MRVAACEFRTRRLRAHAMLAAAVAACCALVAYPALAALLPACPVHAWLGLLCPGCGGTHATLALLHGHVREAWHWNPLFVALIPAALWFGGESYRRALLYCEFRWPQVPADAVYAVAAAAFVFTLARNFA